MYQVGSITPLFLRRFFFNYPKGGCGGGGPRAPSAEVFYAAGSHERAITPIPVEACYSRGFGVLSPKRCSDAYFSGLFTDWSNLASKVAGRVGLGRTT